MNGNENQSNNSNVGVYKANVNLNTAIENPNIDVNSVTDVNIEKSQYSVNNEVSNNFNNDASFLNNNSFGNDNVSLNNNFDNSYNNNVYNNLDISSSYESNFNNDDVSYEPVYEKKEQKGNFKGLFASKELKMSVCIVFLLFIFVLLMPYVYDFLRNLKMSIMG